MNKPRFDIIFDGSVLPGENPLVVKQKIKTLFKLDHHTVKKLFTGSPLVIKKNLDEATLKTYVQALGHTGAKIQINQRPIEQTDHQPQSKIPKKRFTSLLFKQYKRKNDLEQAANSPKNQALNNSPRLLHNNTHRLIINKKPNIAKIVPDTKKA